MFCAKLCMLEVNGELKTKVAHLNVIMNTMNPIFSYKQQKRSLEFEQMATGNSSMLFVESLVAY